MTYLLSHESWESDLSKNTALRMSTGFMKLRLVLHEFSFVSTSLAYLTRPECSWVLVLPGAISVVLDWISGRCGFLKTTTPAQLGT